MDTLKKWIRLQNPVEVAVAASGVSLLAFYLLYARQRLYPKPAPKIENSLDLSLQQLVNNPSPKKQKIIKIVITQAAYGHKQFTSTLITRLKELLLEHGLNTLVNCAYFLAQAQPLKLFKAGTEVFIGTLSKTDPDDEPEYLSLLENALKCQLVVERTITDIQQIKTDDNIYVICDSNSLDLKAGFPEKIWDKFTKKNQINEQDLRDDYKIVFHVKYNSAGGPSQIDEQAMCETTDQSIREAWKGFSQFHKIDYEPYLMLQQNVEIALELIVQKLRPFLPPGVTYVKKEVFTKRI